MNISLTNKASFFILFLVTILFSPLTASSATEEAADWLDEQITIQFQNQTLSDVLEIFSSQTGISIVYDQELAKKKITGAYDNIQISDAINRLFNDKNKSIQIIKDKKVIIVKTFGARNFIWSKATQEDQKKSSKMTLAELEIMHAQQYQEYKGLISNDNEIIKEGGEGMTRGELRVMQAQQYNDYHALISNQNEIIKVGDENMTRGELQAMQVKQAKSYQERINNDDKIIDVGGKAITRGELRAIQAQQLSSYREHVSNTDKIIKTEGMEGNQHITRGAVRAMQNKQKIDYSEKQKDRTRIVDHKVLSTKVN